MLPNGGGTMTNKDIFKGIRFHKINKSEDLTTKNLPFNLMNLFQRMIFHSFKAM